MDSLFGGPISVSTLFSRISLSSVTQHLRVKDHSLLLVVVGPYRELHFSLIQFPFSLTFNSGPASLVAIEEHASSLYGLYSPRIFRYSRTIPPTT